MSGDPPWRRPTEVEFQFAHKETINRRHIRRRSIGGRVQALDWLHAVLVNDAQLYETSDLQNQRDAVAHALCAVVDYLRAQGFTESTVAHLMRPVAALCERENGSIDMMFAEPAKRRGGRPKATLTQLERIGILGAIAEAWLLIHKSEERPQAQKLAECSRRLHETRAQGSGQLPRNTGGAGEAAPAARANRQTRSRERRRASDCRRSYPPAHRGARKWKNRRTIPCNRNGWRWPRDAWRGPARERSANPRR